MTQTELKIKINIYKRKNVNVKKGVRKNKNGSKSTDVRFHVFLRIDLPNYSILLLPIEKEYQTALIIY